MGVPVESESAADALDRRLPWMEPRGRLELSPDEAIRFLND